MTRQQHASTPCACGCGGYPRNFYAEYVAGHRPLPDPIARFWAKVDKSDDCWTWCGPMQSQGYGRFTVRRVQHLAHRYALALALGVEEIDPSLSVDHLCRNRVCVRPDHLEAVTQAVNNERMQVFVRESRTHCRRGHEWTAENTFRNVNGYRECRTCIRDRNASAYAARKAAGR